MGDWLKNTLADMDGLDLEADEDLTAAFATPRSTSGPSFPSGLGTSYLFSSPSSLSGSMGRDRERY